MSKLTVLLFTTLLSINSFAEESSLSCVKGRFDINEIKSGTEELFISHSAKYNFYIQYDAKTKKALLKSKLMNPLAEVFFEDKGNASQRFKIGEAFKSEINTILTASAEAEMRCPCLTMRNESKEEAMRISASGNIKELWSIQYLVYQDIITELAELEEADCSKQDEEEWFDLDLRMKRKYGY